VSQDPVANQLPARGLTFDVRIGGPADGDPVLLLHGFPQNSLEWTGVEPLLHEAGLRTIAPDQRGYSPGARPAEAADYQVGEAADDAIALLDTLGLDRAHVVGHDWGAVAGWFAAARNPARITTLTAVSVPHTAAIADIAARDLGQRARMSYFTLFRQRGIAETTLTALHGKVLRRMFNGSGLDEREVDQYVAPLLEPGALTAALNWYRGTHDRDFAALGPVTVPTTYVWSDGDPVVTRAAAERTAAYVTGPYRFAELAGISHWVPDQAPRELAALILDRVRQPST
jgi:pimeloyl-ACP methyl ester carboxylesterase